ncbi:unnamed protein product [Discosporangium mesarthrocarpum]
MKPAGISQKSGLSLLIDPAVFMGMIGALTPVLTLYIPLSLAIILPVGAVFLVVFRIATGEPKLNFDRLPLIVIVGMLCLGVASLLWSYAPELTVDKLPRTALAVLAGVIFITAVKGLDDRTTRIFILSFLSGMLIVLALVFLERFSGGILLREKIPDVSLNNFLNQFNRPLAVLSVLIWPAIVILSRRHWGLAVLAFGIYASCLMFFITSAAIVAVVIGAIAFVTVYLLPRAGPISVALILSASVLIAPTVDHYLPSPKETFESLDLPRSTYHRLLVWGFTVDRIADRPFLGWGLNASRAVPGAAKSLDVSEPALPLHPHNAALQWRLELGILGVLFGVGLILVSTEMTRRYATERTARAGAVAAIGATFAIAMISFGAWQTWWISGMFLIAGITVLVCRRRPPA